MEQAEDPTSSLIGRRASIARRWRAIEEIDLVRLIADHSMTDSLCGRLERCADRLPAWPDDMEAAMLCEAREAHALGPVGREERLFTVLFERELAEPLCHTLIEAIHLRRIACVVQAQDLIATLRSAIGRERTISSETFGYMLRCFFESCRSAMLLEELSILTLGADRLTGAARAALGARLISAPAEPVSQRPRLAP